MGKFRRQVARIKKAINENNMPRPVARQGVVRSVQHDANGAALATVEFGGGYQESLQASGVFGLEKGALVEALFVDGVVWRWGVKRRPSNVPSASPNGSLSVPVIDTVVDVTNIGATALSGDAGIGAGPQTPRSQGLVVIKCIPEQMAGMTTQYEIQIEDNTTGQTVFQGMSSALGRGIAQLQTALIEGDDDEMFIETWHTAPMANWPSLEYVVTIGDIGTADSENVWVKGPPAPTTPGLFRLPFAGSAIASEYGLRGYTSSAFPLGATATWGAETVVVVTSVSIGFNNLDVNTTYRVRARARGVQLGNESTWSDWTLFTTAYDNTPPGWTGDNTPTVTWQPNTWYITWPPADDYVGGIVDLARYDIRYRTTDSATFGAWSAWLPVGQGTSTTLRATLGERIEVQVRAVDTSGNASSASAAGTAAAIPTPPPYPNLLTNAGFETTLGSEWTLSTLGGGSFARNTTYAVEGSYAGKMMVTRLSSSQNTAELRQTIDMSGYTNWQGKKFTLWCWAYVTDMAAGEYLAFVLNSGYSPKIGAIYHDQVAQGTWVLFSDEGLLAPTPSGTATSIDFVVVATSDGRGEVAGSLTFYLDYLHVSFHE